MFVPVRLPTTGRPNFKVLCARQSRRAADELANTIPGAYVEKHFVNNTPLTPNDLMTIFAS